MSDLTTFDQWLKTDDVAAIVIREHLIPVDGKDGVFFPATYAAGEDGKFAGGYNIDPPQGEKNVCLVDSVGSQANRIEPLFKKEEYAGLVPQITVTAGEKSISLLEAGHRAGDALIRCTALQTPIHDAFKSLQRGDAAPMARIAPTSLVFGVWDSRDTQAKLPRLIASTIRAFNVTRLTRSAQYTPPLEYVSEGLVDAAFDTGKGKENALAKKGFKHNPATGSHGGVIAHGEIRRDAVLSLAALRLLAAGANEEHTLTLRRYVLGLALVAFTANPSTYLRQGCNLVPEVEKPREFTLVHSDGRRNALPLTHAAALKFASDAAKAFGVAGPRVVAFEKDFAKKELAADAERKGKTKGKNKKDANQADSSPAEAEAPQ